MEQLGNFSYALWIMLSDPLMIAIVILSTLSGILLAAVPGSDQHGGPGSGDPVLFLT